MGLDVGIYFSPQDVPIIVIFIQICTKKEKKEYSIFLAFLIDKRTNGH